MGLPLAVDGATNPEAIPDERAYAHFLSAMASADLKTREVALKKVGLDPADRAAFSGALGSLGEELAAVAAQRRAGQAPERILQHQEMAVANARARLQHALSTEGHALFNAYVQTEVKRRIKIRRRKSLEEAGPWDRATFGIRTPLAGMRHRSTITDSRGVLRAALSCFRDDDRHSQR